MLYTNLNVKSHYSILNSALKIDDIISYSLKHFFSYASLIDEKSMMGSLEFIKKCVKNDLKPVIGLDYEITINDNKHNVISIALNNNGLNNLMKISSLLYINDSLTYDNFKELNNDLVHVILLDTSIMYEYYMLNGHFNSDLYSKYYDVLKDFYYFDLNIEEAFMNEFKSLHDKENKYHLACNPIYYEKVEDAYLKKVLNCIKDQTTFDYENDYFQQDEYLVSIDKASTIYTKEQLDNLSYLLSIINIRDIEFKKTLPMFLDDEQTTNNHLKKLCLKGLERRLNNNLNEEYLNRLKYELEVVFQMGYASYFLIVYDYVLFSKKNNILVGPGRGSSAGSLIAYCLGITEVDPIKNNLIFERFLNPNRISMPDIDVDFQDNKRELVIEYLKEKYSKNNIAHIITYGTFQAKNSLRDLARLTNVPNYELDLVLKQIPNLLNVRLIEVVKENKQLQAILQGNEKLAFIYKTSIKLENIIRHYSTHAAGVIISDKSVGEYIPLLNGMNDTYLSQYSMDYLESIGIYKFDILGLKNLGIIGDILEDINENIDLNKISLSDTKTLNLFSNGQTLGIFQFESEGVISVLKRMKVDRLEDLVATTALFRPGPMRYIKDFIERKNNIVKYSYLHNDLKDILEETYGIIVYQEQIMLICQVMANFSLAKADEVRKGMAKKDETLLKEIRDEFITGSINNGYTKEVAIKVYEMILLFSNYGFNKAHAYSYALLGYQLGYLKANYPFSFYKALLSANVYSTKKLKMYFLEMNSLNLKINPPSINYSTNQFEYYNEQFIIPFTLIKGLGENTCLSIIEDRKINGVYKDYISCITRLLSIKISLNTIKSLIYSGCFDEFDFNRSTMVNNLEHISEYALLVGDNTNQMSLELEEIIKYPKITKYANHHDIYKYELEYLGMYISYHPLDDYVEQYQDLGIDKLDTNKNCLVIIDSIKEIRTKKGELMSFIQVSDYLTNKTLVVFPSVYKKYHHLLVKEQVILVSGSFDKNDQDNIIVKDLKILKRGD